MAKDINFIKLEGTKHLSVGNMKQPLIQFIHVNRKNYQGITLQTEWVQNGLKNVSE